MTRPASTAPLAREFDRFLFASIGLDRNGLPLSVVSALARLDIDPWHEASELNLMPREAATNRLALLLARLPDHPSVHQDPAMTAGPVIALLPLHLHGNAASRAAVSGVGTETNSPAALCGFLALMVLLMGAQLFMASRLPQQHLDAAMPVSRTVATMVPPPDLSR